MPELELETRKLRELYHLYLISLQDMERQLIVVEKLLEKAKPLLEEQQTREVLKAARFN